MSDTPETAAPAKKKGKLMKFLLIGVGAIALLGGGVAGGLYASGNLGGGDHAEAEADTPRLVPKDEEKRAAAPEGESGGEEGAAAKAEGMPTPKGSGGDKYASNYYAMEKEFTSNLLDSVHFVQVGIAVSTPYDDRVIENIKTHEIAVRSAVLMALGETDEEAVFTTQGKTALQKRLAAAINATLKEKEGFGGVGNVYFTNFVVQ
ncbi:flagellar basal body-associated FliL family protein [Sphingomonas japonica]|uniref:Flagellar protein FliL n=1 Tax=Sphingomonas japonica TaxID=511662 RepID=A0ABX0U296_9SPHN|nr:flagellar basal body-associated FliL family protein [Sphingomonas japonica]NIJ23826.1 flagellar FliL protein [Sphingomonas japonica]